MTRPTRRATSIFACLVVASTAGAAGPASADDQAAHGAGEHAADAGEALGTVDFGVSCSAAVQPAFDRGLSFLHHMMYEQARAAFEGIVKAIPTARWPTGASRRRCSSRCGPPARAPTI